MLSTQSALPPTYTVTNNFLSHPSAEGLYVVPDPPCTFCGSFSFGLAEQQQFQFVWLYPQTDFHIDSWQGYPYQ